MVAETWNRGDARRPRIVAGPQYRKTKSPIFDNDPYAKELEARLEAQTTTEAKIRLLLAELVTSPKTPAKARAVNLLNPIFERFQIPNQVVSKVWAEAKACLSSPVPEIQRMTLQLMGQCIQLQRGDLHAWQRKDYYDTIQRYSTTSLEEVTYLGNALNTLIDNGRNIEGVSSTLLTLLLRWIHFCTANSSPDDGSESIHSSTNGVSTVESNSVRAALMSTVVQIFKYSFGELEEQDISSFFDFLCNQLAVRTITDGIIESVLTVIEVIPIDDNIIPAVAASHIIGFICLHYKRRKTDRTLNFPKRFWNIIRIFLGLDYVAHQSLTILEHLPSNHHLGLGRRDLSKYRIRGALAIMGKCLEAQQCPNRFKATLSLTSALHCIKHASCNPDVEVKSSAVCLLSEILASDGIRGGLKYEDWEIIWDSLEVLLTFFSDPIQSLEVRRDSDSTSSKDKQLNEKLQHELVVVAGRLREICVMEDYTGTLARCVTFQSSLSKVTQFDNHDFVLKNYEATGLCMPGNSNWIGECEVILKDYACNDSRPRLVRIEAIKILAKPIQFVTQDTDPLNEDFYKRIIVPLTRLLRSESDEHVCRAILTIAVDISNSEREHWAIEFTKAIYVAATKTLPDIREPKEDSYDTSGTTETQETSEPLKPPYSVQHEAVMGLIAILERSLGRNSPELGQRVFMDLVELAQKSTKDASVRFEAVGALLRLRADSMYSVYFTSLLSRPYTNITITDNPKQKAYSPTESFYNSPKDIGIPPDIQSCENEFAMIGGLLRSTDDLTRSPLKTFDDHTSDDEVEDDDPFLEGSYFHRHIRERNVLPVSPWFETVINIIHQGGNWDLYNHVLGFFPYQLCNKTFFAACTSSIIRLRDVLCHQLGSLQFPHFEKVPELDTSGPAKTVISIKDGKLLKEFSQLSQTQRMGIIGRLHSILAILIGYHHDFVKASRDELARTFQNDMGRHNDTVTIMCIHSFMVCCHELPKSTARCLPGILQTLSQQITNSKLSIHILEFLIGVGRIPVIHDTFHMDEFLLVFQVALKFLEYFREKQLLQEFSTGLAQYIVHLAYEALTVWFLALKLENRRSYVSWLVRKLILVNESKEKELDEHAVVFVDMLERFSFSDSPLKKYPDTVEDGELAHYKKHWVVGRSVHTAQVVREDGLVKITVRKPASMLVTYHQAEVDFDSDAIRAGRKKLTIAELTTLPSYMITQMHTTDQPPILLSDDESMLRSIRLLDRMPVVNFHTIGITYVGWGQKTEEEILSNEIGSPEYQRFLDGIGTTVRLKGNTEIYHGGLDVRDDQDGTHAYFWSDKTTQVTFITYTMIPLNKEGDRRLAFSNKKRNAANCFVNIIWNDSNDPYSLDTMPSEFNSNSIVISRHSHVTANADSILSSEINPRTEQFFKVKLIQTEGMPEISPIIIEKIISGSSLAAFVRDVALKLSIFCQIYIGKRDKSHWVARLDQINQIRHRALQKRDSIDSHPVPRTPLSPSYSNAALATMGRRATNADVRTELTAQWEEDLPLAKKYDFSRYT